MEKEDYYEIQITMLGGRRCGKTSILASMCKNFKEDVSSGTDLKLAKGDITTAKALNKKLEEIENFFEDKKGHFSPDLNLTRGFVDYSFILNLANKKGKDSNIKLTFNDMGGESMKVDDENHKKLEDKVKSSDVLIVCIDTPYLLEEKGIYNNKRNNVREISDLIAECFEKSEEENKYKMVLFVPLKCERWYDQNRIDKIFSAVKECYKVLINDIQKYCYIATIPIQTMGDIIFTRFKKDDNNNIIMNEKYGFPYKPIFHFKADNPEYSPKYCEIPLLYTISYSLHMMEMSLKNKEIKREKNPWFLGLGGFFNIIREKIFKCPTALDFMNQKELIDNKLKENRNVEILSNPLDF